MSNTDVNQTKPTNAHGGFFKRLAPETFLFLIILGVYLETRMVSVGWVDAADFSTAATLLTVPHPTGYPFAVLWMALAGIFPFNPPAASSLITVLGTMGAIIVAYYLLREILGSLGEIWARLGAVAGALALALAPLNWKLATTGEIYPMALAGGLSVTYLALRLWRTPSPQPAGLLALCLGVLPWLHLTALVWMPAGLAALYKARKCFHPVYSLAFLLLGFSVGLYLPLRALIAEPGHWKVAARAEGLWEHIVGGQFRSRLSFDPSLWWGRLKILINQLQLTVPVPLLILILPALIRSWGKLAAIWLIILPALCAEFFAINYHVFDPQSYHLPILAMLCIMWGSGLAVLAEFTATKLFGVRPSRMIFATFLLASFGAALITRYDAMDLSRDKLAERYACGALAIVPYEARFMPADIDNTFLAWNMLQVELKRPDLELLTINDLSLSMREYYWLLKRPGRITISEPGAMMDTADSEIVSSAQLAGCWAVVGGSYEKEKAMALWNSMAAELLADPSLPRDEAARRMLGSIYSDRAMWRIQNAPLHPKEQQGEWNAALVDLENALGFDPQNLYATINMAYLLLSADEEDAALVYAKRAVELRPELPQSWIALGTVNLVIGYHDEAQRAFTRARELRH